MAESRGLGREVVVGSIVLVALLIFVSGTMFLSGRSILRRDGMLGFPGQTQREIVLHHRSRLAQLAFSSEAEARISQVRCECR